MVAKDAAIVAKDAIMVAKGAAVIAKDAVMVAKYAVLVAMDAALITKDIFTCDGLPSTAVKACSGRIFVLTYKQDVFEFID